MRAHIITTTYTHAIAHASRFTQQSNTSTDITAHHVARNAAQQHNTDTHNRHTPLILEHVNIEKKTEKEKEEKNVKRVHAWAAMETVNGEDDVGEGHHG